MFISNVFAATLTLDKIGALATSGKVYSEWWYTVANPILIGMASPNKTVTITIDGTSSSVTANSAGNWYYSPTTLTIGDHNVKIESEGLLLAFKLHIGQGLPTFTYSGTVQTTQSTVPVTGIDNIFYISLASSLILFGMYFLMRFNVLREFEDRVTRG